MPFDGTAIAAPRRASFAEAAIALMLRDARSDGSGAPDLCAELRSLAAARGPEARLWDAYSGGRIGARGPLVIEHRVHECVR